MNFIGYPQCNNFLRGCRSQNHEEFHTAVTLLCITLFTWRCMNLNQSRLGFEELFHVSGQFSIKSCIYDLYRTYHPFAFKTLEMCSIEKKILRARSNFCHMAIEREFFLLGETQYLYSKCKIFFNFTHIHNTLRPPVYTCVNELLPWLVSIKNKRNLLSISLIL